MDRTTRWETEAIRKRPPKPSSRQSITAGRGSSVNWVTLREAEAATGIPVNTLRKWARKDHIPSYLESDGDLALRMVDLDGVRQHAVELGRSLAAPQETTSAEPVPDPARGLADPPGSPRPQVGPRPSTLKGGPSVSEHDSDPEPPPPDTMIVPVDAWNKMLNQLGNLHEAGQQLAEARERAAKAETEAKFLRAQLAEGRAAERQEERSSLQGGQDGEQDQENGSSLQEGQANEESQGGLRASEHERGTDTTTYWRYLTSGWRDRKRRRN